MLFLKTVFLTLILAIFANGAALPSGGKFIKLDFTIEKSLQGDTLGHVPKTGPGAKVKRAGTEKIALYNEQVYYSLNVAFGSNKQKVTLDIDTGSSDTWVVDKSATCNPTYSGQSSDFCKTNGVFDSSKSTTYNSLGQSFHIQYGDQTSSDGTWAKDDIYLPSGDKVLQLQIGDVTSTSVNLGLLGIGYKTNEANAYYDNFPILLKKQGFISVNGYALYLNSPSATSGSVIFGGYDTNKVTGNFPTLPVTSSRELSIALASVVANGKTIPVAGPALLDSGTTLTYLPTTAFNAVGTALGGTYNSNLEAYTISCNQPSNKYLSYNFNGVTIKVPLSNLPISLYDQNGNVIQGTCALGVFDSGDTLSILGDNFLRSAYVVYNLDANTIRIGQASYSSSENIVSI